MMSRSYYMGHIAKVSGSAPKNVIKVAMCALGAYMLMAIGWSLIVALQVQKGRSEAFTSGAVYGLVLYG
jgi:hypothetical protein